MPRGDSKNKEAYRTEAKRVTVPGMRKLLIASPIAMALAGCSYPQTYEECLLYEYGKIGVNINDRIDALINNSCERNFPFERPVEGFKINSWYTEEVDLETDILLGYRVESVRFRVFKGSCVEDNREDYKYITYRYDVHEGRYLVSHNPSGEYRCGMIDDAIFTGVRIR